MGGMVEPLEHIGDLRAAAVDYHHADANEREQDDIAHHRFAQLFGDHGVAAVFHHNGLAGEFLNIRQGLYQSLGLLSVRRHGMSSFRGSNQDL